MLYPVWMALLYRKVLTDEHIFITDMGTPMDLSNISIGTFRHSLEPSQYRYLSYIYYKLHSFYICNTVYIYIPYIQSGTTYVEFGGLFSLNFEMILFALLLLNVT